MKEMCTSQIKVKYRSIPFFYATPIFHYKFLSGRKRKQLFQIQSLESLTTSHILRHVNLPPKTETEFEKYHIKCLYDIQTYSVTDEITAASLSNFKCVITTQNKTVLASPGLTF
jgi:hypothetical protein